MEEQKIKDTVAHYYRNGFHCAEAIVNSIQELVPTGNKSSCKVASGFCGGIGKCKQDICGALSGGIIVLGSFYGREKGGEDINKLVFLAAELRRLFLDEFKSTVCKNVIENIENREEYKNCQDVTAKTTVLLYHLICNNK
ncbi:MAG: C-GCAxxG-C-C family protein [Bacteroidota bacterium]|jgi:C_GCAxxG_C_C family probable redox protein